jgi:hemolysin activation/secretion protein
MAGRDLDRFSRYSFGTFDNRLRGYPSALIRYDRGAVLRGALAWAAAPLIRVDAFADTAAVHDPGFGRRSRSYTGIGAAIEVPAPFGTLVAVEWGYGFQGINSNGSRGTQVVRISGYKMF